MCATIPVLADMAASGIRRGRNKTTELGELGRHCPLVCVTEGDQKEEPAAAEMFDPGPLTEDQHWEGRSLPNVWTATNSNPATAGLKMLVTQEPANETVSDCLLSKRRLENNRTIPFSRQIYP